LEETRRLAKNAASARRPIAAGADLPAGIEVTFSREGQAGTRTISVTTCADTVSTVISVCDQRPPRPAGDLCYDNCFLHLIGRGPIEQVPAAADDTDGADANAGPDFGWVKAGKKYLKIQTSSMCSS
jgi:hypothetical protein